VIGHSRSKLGRFTVHDPVSLAGAVLAPAVCGPVGVSERGPVTGKFLSVMCTNKQFLTLK